MKILCIAGPTASGKTAFSLEIAQYLKKHDLEVNIINVDSCQLYKDFPIISAQPSYEEQNQAKHSLFGILQLEDKSSAGFWLELASNEIKKSIDKGEIPILVGGTGMYFKTLLDGIIQIPNISDDIRDKLNNDYKNKGISYLYDKLKVIDEEFSKKIHINDRQRILRALEVYKQTGKTLTSWHKEHQENLGNNRKYNALQIGIGMPLDELSPYLYKRTKIMLENNALEEVKLALAKNLTMSAPAFSSIGCRELGAYLQGKTSLEQACELWNKNTRAYAKRQWTWFRANKAIEWCYPFDTEKRKELIEKTYSFFIG